VSKLCSRRPGTRPAYRRLREKRTASRSCRASVAASVSRCKPRVAQPGRKRCRTHGGELAVASQQAGTRCKRLFRRAASLSSASAARTLNRSGRGWGGGAGNGKVVEVIHDGPPFKRVSRLDLRPVESRFRTAPKSRASRLSSEERCPMVKVDCLARMSLSRERGGGRRFLVERLPLAQAEPAPSWVRAPGFRRTSSHLDAFRRRGEEGAPQRDDRRCLMAKGGELLASRRRLEQVDLTAARSSPK